MKRFYKDVSVSPVDGGWHVTLDGRGIKTPGRASQIVPSEALAGLLAEEWRAQGEKIDPRSFVYRDMADYAIDVVRKDRADAVGNLLNYSQTDTLCYRGDPEDPLFQRQEELWEPLLKTCEARHGITFSRVSGIMFDQQPEATQQRLREVLDAMDDFTLAGLQTMTSIAASLVVGLEALEDGADPEQLFATANAEEDWQAELWGWDFEAEDRRKLRLEAFTLAHEFVKAARG
ncbi:ATP12 family chaperone protein [Alteraurantiacibacter aquimixticola]|uniref:Molecular chaperone n=1 Tax=Alteraurantiacibacter aquimixticola TaxID=2489173 RepID=A0A4T3F292_9SPHN|nr:ATP12 family protein [Alteraurantiacibacter aquimixticola]TIX51296.1 molecular chaperone [Alteraurantiacibacter aquimixticola]